MIVSIVPRHCERLTLKAGKGLNFPASWPVTAHPFSEGLLGNRVVA